MSAAGLAITVLIPLSCAWVGILVGRELEARAWRASAERDGQLHVDSLRGRVYRVTRER